MMATATSNPAKVADDIVHLLEERGTGDYIGENISQLEHSLQAANFAAQAGESIDNPKRGYFLLFVFLTHRRNREQGRNSDRRSAPRHRTVPPARRGEGCPDGYGGSLGRTGRARENRRGVLKKPWVWRPRLETRGESRRCEKVGLRDLNGRT
jgi:hypothetical protein